MAPSHVLVGLGQTAAFWGCPQPPTPSPPPPPSLRCPETCCTRSISPLCPHRGLCHPQGLGHGGVGAAQAGRADGPPRPQAVGAAPLALPCGAVSGSSASWVQQLPLGTEREGGREGGQQLPAGPTSPLCPHHGWCQPWEPLHAPCTCFSGSLRMLGKTKGRTTSWGTWSCA